MSWFVNKQGILLISPELSVSSGCTMICDGQDEEDSALSHLCVYEQSAQVILLLQHIFLSKSLNIITYCTHSF